MTKGLTPFVVAGLLACMGCAVRTATAPAAVAPAEVPRSAPQKPPSQPAAAAPRTEVVTTVGAPPATAAPALAPPTDRATVNAPPPAGTKAAVNKPAGDPPPATASAYVYSPQQAASATPSATAPQAIPPRAAVPTPDPVKPSPIAPTTTNAPADTTPPPTQRGELQLAVVTSSSEIAAGGIVTVDVMASSDTAVLDAPLHLSFDPNVMAYLDGAPGDFLTQGGSSVVFLADGATRPGDVAVAAGRVDRSQGATGSGLLCRVRLRAVAAGTSPVSVAQAKAWGVHGEELTVLPGGSTVSVR